MKIFSNNTYQILVFSLAISFILPFLAFADVNNLGSQQIISNPLKADNFSEFLALVLNAIIDIGIPILVLMFVYIGFLFVFAQGNSNKLKEARTALWYGVLGAFLILGSFVLERVITDTLSPFLK
jgi:hypothetical protein